MRTNSAPSPRRTQSSFRFMRLLHDLPAREHDAEEEQDGDRAGVRDDLDQAEELGAEEDVDRADGDERDREPEDAVDEALRGDDQVRGGDLHDGEDQEGGA